ncbi:MAG TPA: hypothetical protein OIM63_03465 [Bacilli bacterium]|nr:hypothetical protein [Bacilli bacterium]
MNDNEMIITDNNGISTKLNVLSFIDDPLKEETYVIYTDGSMDVNNELNIFASLIVTDGDNVVLENVLDEDLDFINEEISKMTNKKQ